MLAAAAQPSLSWLDDVSLLLGAPDAESILSCTARAACLAHQYLALTGVSVNYAAGKTEAIVLFAGRGAVAARKKLFLERGGRVDVPLPGGEHRHLRCVSEYTHLGTVRTHTASCERAVRRREQLAREILQPFKRHIMANRALLHAERQELFKSMILAKFLHGIGTMELGCKQAYSSFAKKYVGLGRSVVRPLYGLPCRRLSDEQVCALLAIALPREVMDIAIVRTWACVAERGDQYLHACLLDSHWATEAWRAGARVAARFQGSSFAAYIQKSDRGVAGLCAFPLSPQQTRSLLKCYRTACVMSRADLCEPALRKACAHDKVEQNGLTYFRVACDRLRRPPVHQCAQCGLPFDTGAALGAHMAKVHSCAAPAAHGFGTACEVCRKTVLVDQAPTRAPTQGHPMFSGIRRSRLGSRAACRNHSRPASSAGSTGRASTMVGRPRFC